MGWLNNLLGRGASDAGGPRALDRQDLAEIERWLEVGVRRAPAETLERLGNTCAEALGAGIADPRVVELAGDLALHTDDFEQCIRDYRRVLDAVPDNARAHYKLGVSLELTGLVADAISTYRRCLELQPDHPKALNNLGCLLEQMGQEETAENLYRRALKSDPELPQGYVNLANLLNRRGNFDEAAEKYLLAIKYLRAEQGADEQHLDTLRSLGNIYLKQKRHAELEVCCREALEVKPDDVGANFHLGNVLLARLDLDEASNRFKEALRLDPDLAAAYNNLGNICKWKEQVEEAVRCYESAIRLDPNECGPYSNLGILQLRLGRLEQGISLLRKSLEIAPDFEDGQSNLLFALNYLHGNDPGLVSQEHATWGARLARKYLQPRDFRNSRAPGKRLRVGYVSPDFRRHSVSYFMLPVVQHHDRAEMEVFCYANIPNADSVTEEFQRACDHWRPISKIPFDEVVRMILEDEIDILVDLAGYTSGNRMDLFAGRAAPIQVSYLGYPNTTGLPTMDYRLTDPEADPEGVTDRYHTERLVRLSNGFLCYQPPANSPEVGAPPHRSTGTITFGSFNNYAKVAPQTYDLWARVLNAVPNSRLLLKSLGLGASEVQREIIDRFTALGVAEGRIVICGSDESLQGHLARYNEVDIALDVFPYNGTTTTCEALWMGVPVLSLSGAAHVSRVGRSILTCVELPELVAHTPDEFVSKAVALAGDTERLAALRAGLRQRLLASGLCDAPGFTRELERAFRAMWQEWCDNPERSATSELAAAMSRAASVGVFGDSTEIQIRIKDGSEIAVPNSIASLTPYVLLEQEDWFEDEIQFVRESLEPGMSAVDIGANYGVFTMVIARAVGEKGRVWSFEPASNTAAFLRRTLDSNAVTNAQVLTIGLSDTKGNAWLKLNPNPELNMVVSEPVDAEEVEAISLTSLDESAEEFGIAGVAFMKMDAEGQEANILLGGRRTLERESPLILFEIKHGDQLNYALVDMFRELEYQPYRLVPGLNLLAPFPPDEPADPFQLNLFCCKTDRAQVLRERGLLADRVDPPSLTTVASTGWGKMAAGLAYAQPLLSSAAWNSADQIAGSAEYLEALDWFAIAHGDDVTSDIRLAALEKAMAGISAAIAAAETLPRMLSLIRVSWEHGARYAAVQGLKKVLRILRDGEDPVLGEPFLAVSRRFEHIAPGAHLSAWIEASAIEQHEKLRSFSSYFLDQGTLPALARLQSLGYMTPEMERRRQLIRMRHGLQERPEPCDLLSRRSPDNLNPQLWGA